MRTNFGIEEVEVMRILLFLIIYGGAVALNVSGFVDLWILPEIFSLST